MYDIIIIGAGPAGLTAAIYARRASKTVLVLEAKTYGGQIITTNKIDNYPAEPGISGPEFAKKLYDQVIELGAEVVFEKALDIHNLEDKKEVVTANKVYEAKAIIIATGVDNRKIGLENEEKLTGKGVSYCATCDGAFFKNQDVAVVGGGNTALQDALYLSNICNKVYLIHRRDEFRADENTVEKLKEKDNVEFVLNSVVTKLEEENDSLVGIEVKDKEGNISNMSITGIFVAVGQVPENQNFAKFAKMDDKGYIIAGENCHTETEGIFVAGDNRVKEVRQLVTAASDGAIAATEAVKYIRELKKKEQ